jgi:hypothetical protein
MLKGKKTKAQVSLELGLAFVCIFILLIASVRLSFWLVSRMVARQQDFEGSRPRATSDLLGTEVDEPNSSGRYPPLRFF